MNKVLVIGGAGYIGSHTVKALKAASYEAIVYDDLSSGHVEAIKGCKLIEGSLDNKELLSSTLKAECVKAVLHFGGKIDVAESVLDPQKYFKNNFYDSFNILLAMLENNIENIIFSSTAAVYGNPDEIPISEETATHPTNPYGLSKLLFEQALDYYSKQGSINYVALRYFNAAGADVEGNLGADHANKTHLVTLAVLAALGKWEQFKLYGTDYDTMDGTCVRDYIHVDDLANAHILALDYLFKGNKSSVFNLGTGNGYTNRQVIEMVKKVSGSDFKVVETARRSGDPAKLIASSKKAQEILGWQQKYSDLETIISTAYKWHKNNPMGYEKSNVKIPPNLPLRKGGVKILPPL